MSASRQDARGKTFYALLFTGILFLGGVAVIATAVKLHDLSLGKVGVWLMAPLLVVGVVWLYFGGKEK